MGERAHPGLKVQSGCYSLCMFSDTVADLSSLTSLLGGDESDIPASLSIMGSTLTNMPYLYAYQYQINNPYGTPVTGSNYYWAEYGVTADFTSNGVYLPAPNGVITDYVGLAAYSIPPEYYGASTTPTTQQFNVLYEGYFYDLSTVLLHTTTVGPTGTVTVNVSIYSP
jgi:hypothetical protein